MTKQNVVDLYPTVKPSTLRMRKLRARRKAEAEQAVTAPSPIATVASQAPSWLLVTASLGLAVVGVTVNAWYAASLGASDAAGMLFRAVGICSDLAGLALPAKAAMLWYSGKRGPAVTAWLAFGVTVAFALTASIGFASLNIADTTAARASRVTPAVTAAQTALDDATAARDRECKGGVGKFCRDREAGVAERRRLLDQATAAGAATADPQAMAAVKLVAWASAGQLRPTEDDFAMLRLMLLALLPQLGGVLMMVGRAR